jgi:hypothetical protein
MFEVCGVKLAGHGPKFGELMGTLKEPEDSYAFSI